jgi:hypothetical protein
MKQASTKTGVPMSTLSPLGVGLVFTNENGNVSVSKLALESRTLAVTWAKRNFKALGATRLKASNQDVKGFFGDGEVRWSFLELSLVPKEAKEVPQLFLQVAFN